jgi:hypothetical protein
MLRLCALLRLFWEEHNPARRDRESLDALQTGSTTIAWNKLLPTLMASVMAASHKQTLVATVRIPIADYTHHGWLLPRASS